MSRSQLSRIAVRAQAVRLERFGGGCAVLEGRDGNDGTDRFREHGAEIAIEVLDLIMPGRSGVQVAQEIRVLLPSIPVVRSPSTRG